MNIEHWTGWHTEMYVWMCVLLLCNTMANEVSVWFQSGQTGRISYRPCQQNMTFNAKKTQLRQRRDTCSTHIIHNASWKRFHLKKSANAMPWRNFILGQQFNKTKKICIWHQFIHSLAVSLTHTHIQLVVVFAFCFIITFFQFVSILKPSVECLLCSFSFFLGLVILYILKILPRTHPHTKE